MEEIKIEENNARDTMAQRGDEANIDTGGMVLADYNKRAQNRKPP